MISVYGNIIKYALFLTISLFAFSCSQSNNLVKASSKNRQVTLKEIHQLVNIPVYVEDMEKVIAGYNKQISLNKNQPILYIKRGDARFKIHQYKEAVKDYTTAIKLNDIDEAYFKRGLTFGRMADFDKGIADLTTYITRHPKSSIAYTKRGIRYIWKEDFEKAKENFIVATTLNANNAEAHDDLGVIYARKGEYGRAIEHFLATIKADPTYQKAYHNLAIAYYTIQEDKLALNAINGALSLSPDARNSMMLKSLVLKSLGRHAEAKKIKEKAQFLPNVCHWTESVPIK